MCKLHLHVHRETVQHFGKRKKSALLKSTCHVTEYAVCYLAILFHKEHVVIRLGGIFT